MIATLVDTLLRFIVNWPRNSLRSNFYDWLNLGLFSAFNLLSLMI